MKFASDKHDRRSLRLQGYDYAQAGAYFVTVCTQNRERLFGEIVDGEIQLNPYGVVVQSCWDGCTYLYIPGKELKVHPSLKRHTRAAEKVHPVTYEVVRAGKPVAELSPVAPRAETLHPFGLCAGEFRVPDDFDAPLPEDILKAFEGQ